MQGNPHQSGELFPDPRGLGRGMFAVRGCCIVLGTVLLFIAVLIIVIEVFTSPRATTMTKFIGITSACVSGVHVMREARSLSDFRWKRWLLFGVSIAGLNYAIWTTVADPIGRLVFTAMLILSASALMFVRLIAVWHRHRDDRHSR